MRKEEFTFESRDNASKISAVRWMPEDGEIKGIIQIVHGMAEHKGRYESFAAFLTSKQFAVVAEDHLGHGASVPEGGTKGYFCEQDPATVVVRDVHRLKKMTQEKYPGVPYFLFGHSMGSFIVRNYITKYGTGIQGALIFGTGMQSSLLVGSGRALMKTIRLFKGDKHVSPFLNNMAFGSYLKRIHPARTPHDWITKDEAVVDAYAADENCGFIFTVNGFDTLTELIKRMKNKKALAAIPKDLPLYFASGTEDPVGDYGKGVRASFKMYQNLGIKDLTLKMYENDRHELFNETDKENVMEDMVSWVEKHLA